MNNAKQIRDFFSTEDKPVSLTEFKEFWTSLSAEEKDEYKTADLTA